MSNVTIWVAYNTDDQCFASHESAQEAIEGLVEGFGYGEGARVVELQLKLPSAQPIAAQASVVDDDDIVSVSVE
ncbi:hypothetical protein [Hyphomicrobium sp. MC8b]|uniref:hypothetical protein n=1 Tax=Hyphomicrobium sp. MC8b TaxID=300273 RepID=UPI00391DC3FD